MDLKLVYEELVAATELVFGLVVVRAQPMNLRVELIAPAVALGWHTAEVSDDEFLSGILDEYSFMLAYFGESEEDLLAKLALMDDYLARLPNNASIGSVTRIKNELSSKTLDYGFTTLIKIKEA